MRGLSLSSAAVATLLGIALVTGCGDQAAPAAAPPTGAEAQSCQAVTGNAPWHGMLRVHGDRATLEAYDDFFAPNCLVVPAGQAVTMVLTNRGHVPHVLGGPGSPVAGSLDAGQTAFLTLPPLQRPLRLVCDLHEDEHMVMAVVPSSGGAGDV